MAPIKLPFRQPLDIQASRRGIVPSPFSEASERSQASVALTPWWVERPPFATDFFATDKGTILAAGPGAPTELPGTVFTLPTGDAVAVIKAVTIFINAPTVLTDVDWQIQINEGPVAGWDQLTTFPRAAANLSIDFGGTIFVTQGARIRMVATNQSAAGPWTVGGSFTGWYLSQSDIQRVFGRVGY